MNFFWSSFEFIANVLEASLLYLFIKIFSEKITDDKKKIIGAILSISLIAHISIRILRIGSFPAFIIICLSSTFIFKLLFNTSIPMVILGILSYFIAMTFFELLMVVIAAYILNKPTSFITEPTLYRVFCVLIIKGLLFLLLIGLRTLKNKFNIKNIKKLYIYEIILILIFITSIIFTLINIYKSESLWKISNLKILLTTLATFVFTLIIAKIINQIVKYSQKEAQWELREQEYQRQITYMKNMEELTYRLKAQRHDFNHHIGCIYGLLQVGNIDDAKKYTKDLVSSISEINTIVNIDNPIIASIMNFKLALAKEKDIELDININIPNDLNIDSTDISIILGNALDNAIEACEKTYKKAIWIKMYIQSEHLIIKITNTKDTKISSEENKTTKANKEDHGFGLENINYVVEKYDGILKAEDNVDTFSLNIALNIQPKNNPILTTI